LLISFISFFPIYVSSWFLCGLAGDAKNLVRALEIRFLAHGVMNALGIVYPQYWLQPDCDASFANLLQVFKTTFYYGKIMCNADEQEVQV
jgi:hypothetical protein